MACFDRKGDASSCCGAMPTWSFLSGDANAVAIESWLNSRSFWPEPDNRFRPHPGRCVADRQPGPEHGGGPCPFGCAVGGRRVGAVPCGGSVGPSANRRTDTRSLPQDRPLPRPVHDSLFRALVDDPRRAAALLAGHLPADVASRLDPAFPPEHLEGTFIDDAGNRSQCDALFRVRLRGGEEARVYALLEHKSAIDPGTPLQLVRYVLNVWAREIEDRRSGAGSLPLVIPVVFYHGTGSWGVPLSVRDMIAVPEGLEGYADRFGEYVLRDLGGMDQRELSDDPSVLAALLALGRTGRGITDAELELILAVVAESGFGHYVLAYVVERTELTLERLDAALGRARPDDRERLMGTVAQEIFDEGIERGIEQGIERGKAAMLLRQMTLKFGSVSGPDRDRIGSASPDELDAWSGAILEAQSPEAVFAAGQPR